MFPFLIILFPGEVKYKCNDWGSTAGCGPSCFPCNYFMYSERSEALVQMRGPVGVERGGESISCSFRSCRFILL